MKKDLVEDIKARLSVEEVVGDYITLLPAGRNYKALSPFKSEKTPSLIVTPSKEIWKDFSSGKGGSLFNFVMEHEGVDFKQALQILAQKAGLDPADYYTARRSSDKTAALKELLDINEKAAVFYTDQLHKTPLALRYLKKRGFNDETIKTFRFGYAPKDWESLYRHLKAKKVSGRRAVDSGLIRKREVPEWKRVKEKIKTTHVWGDFFGDRLMIPLSDPQGRIVGFTGRQLKESDKGGKYVNTPASPVYNKSKHVFGYFQAKDSIRKLKQVIVVEGNLDVVACHQAGYTQTVAISGTALTADHCKILGRLTRDVHLAFDGDAAGTAAMERSLPIAITTGVNLSIIDLPAGSDPDDLIQKNVATWQKLVEQPVPALDWLHGKYKAQLNVKTVTGKRQLTDVMLPLIAQLQDPVEQDGYLKKLEADDISRSALDKKLKQLAQGDMKPTKTSTKTPPLQPEPTKTARTSAPSATSDLDALYQATSVASLSTGADMRIKLLLGLLLLEPQLRQPDTSTNQRLQTILQKDSPDCRLYKLLQTTQLPIREVKQLPTKSKILQQCAQSALEQVAKIHLGKLGLADKMTEFSAYYEYLDAYQSKKENLSEAKVKSA